MNLIRFVSKSKIVTVPKVDSLVVPTSSFVLPGVVLNELRLARLSHLARADGTLQFPRTNGLKVSDPLSTSILHLLGNGGESDFDSDEAAD